MRRDRRRARTLLAVCATASLVAAGCSGDDEPETSRSGTGDGTGSSNTSGTTTGGSGNSGSPPGGGEGVVAAGEPFPEARCEANREAGTITYLSGFDLAAAASIVEVLVADEKGYFEDMCLDVEITPSFSTANYQPIAAGDAQMASGGSFSEVVSYGQANDAELVALAVDGRAPIDQLILKPGTASELAELEGATIGVKGRIPPSIAAMLATAGLIEGDDYQTVLLTGFDPLAHFEVRSIAGLPGYRSNEPGQLERAGVDFELFDPIDFDVPGSFGVIVSSADFVNEHPTAAQDFMRAAMKGLADAIEDPEAATAIAVERINGGDNPNFLSPESEGFRWQTEAELVTGSPDAPAGVIDPAALQTEVDAYAELGIFGDETPDAATFTADVLSEVYADDGTVIWPST